MTLRQAPSRHRSSALPLAAGLALVLALAACTGPQQPAATSSPLSTENPGTVAGVPIPAGQIDRAVEQLPDLARAILAKTNVPGLAVGVTYRGKTVFARGYGVRKVGEEAKVDADTVFQLASLSKGVGATVIANEVGTGTVAWDTPLQKNLPGFELSDPWVSSHVTIADMYTHRSGLPDHVGDTLEEIGFDQTEILRRLRLAPLEDFRVDSVYTNFGITAAAESVAAAAQVDWATLSQNDIYAPLGMTSTSSRFSDFLARSNRASGHVLVDGAYQAKYQRQPDAQSPAGGVSSSVDDMNKWMAMVLDGGKFDGDEIVDPAALTPAITPEIVTTHPETPEGRAGFTGYGFNVSDQPTGRTMLSHSGAFGLGAGTNVVMLPSERLGIIVLTNAAPVGAAETLAMEFMDLAQYGHAKFDWSALYEPYFETLNAPFGELVGKTPPASPAAASPDAALVGSYANDYHGPASVEERNGGLVVVLGPGAVEYPLTHWDGDTFTTPIRSENAEPGSISQVRFQAAAGGQASSLIFEYFNTEGLGTFTR